MTGAKAPRKPGFGRTKRPARGKVPLERALSKLGLASRTEARALIRDGKVRVHGRVATDPLALIVPETAKIEIENQWITAANPKTVMLHKTKGVVTTRSDEKNRPTVYSLIEEIQEHLVPIGRLDMATTGLLLFTNDTRFASWVTDPKNNVEKIYVVTVCGEVSSDAAKQLEEGLRDDGELLKAKQVIVQKHSKRESHLLVTLSEGKNREIRRLFSAIGCEVTRLKRIRFGGLALSDLAPGAWREVSTAELKAAFPGAPIKG